MAIDTSTTEGVVIVLAAMTAASYFTRVVGFFLMRFVAVTPWVEAWLGALPLAVMGSILAPIAIHGGPAEWAGFVATFVIWRLKGDDIFAALGGVAAVALVRAILG